MAKAGALVGPTRGGRGGGARGAELVEQLAVALFGVGAGFDEDGLAEGLGGALERRHRRRLRVTDQGLSRRDAGGGAIGGGAQDGQVAGRAEADAGALLQLPQE